MSSPRRGSRGVRRVVGALLLAVAVAGCGSDGTGGGDAGGGTGGPSRGGSGGGGGGGGGRGGGFTPDGGLPDGFSFDANLGDLGVATCAAGVTDGAACGAGDTGCLPAAGGFCFCQTGTWSCF